MSPRRRKDRHEASGFSRRPDPDSDEDEDYERERRKRSKRAVYFLNRRKMQGGGGYGHSPGLMYFVFLLAERHTVNIRAIGINPVFYYIITILMQCSFFSPWRRCILNYLWLSTGLSIPILSLCTV